MKKNLFLVGSLFLSLSSFATEIANYNGSETSNDVLPTMFTLQYGLIHTNCVEGSDALQYVPTKLQGITLTAQWEVAKSGDVNHFIGVNTGYYTGSQSDIYGSSTEEGTVDVFPILLTYNVEYQLNDKLVVYAGVRGGAVIRDTSMYYGRSNGSSVYDDTSVNPMLSLGLGARASISQNWSFDIGYDFGYSFGDDCKIGQPNNKYSSYNYTRYAEAPGNHRYYGTVKVGFTYSF